MRAILWVSVLAAIPAVPSVGQATRPAAPAAERPGGEPVDVSDFYDAIAHYQMNLETLDYVQYAPDEVAAIADNLLLWQTEAGGWPKDEDWLRVLSPQEASALREDGPDAPPTLDNRSTWSHIQYLAEAHQHTGDERYAQAALRGIDWVLATQNRAGGWDGGRPDMIAYNDDVMVGATRLMGRVGSMAPPFDFVDGRRGHLARMAYSRAMNAILQTQVRVDGQRTAWGQQHSVDTLEPIWARTFEPPAISGRESVDVVRYLMTIEQPSPAVIAAVQGAVAWFDRAKLEGLRLVERQTDPEFYRHHISRFDRVLVEDPDGPPLWARYYSLEDGVTPLWPDRDRQMRASYNDISRERRTGYAYVGRWPAALLAEEYAAWRERVGEAGVAE
jgi:PelA/Pel-15E family pectate lyase